MFDAVSIEHSFAIFFEQLGSRDLHDAAVFRSGEAAEYGELLEAFARHFENRLDRIAFTPAESQNAGSRARLDVAIQRLRKHAETLKTSSFEERDDHHWLIIGALVLSVAALLDHLEGKGVSKIQEHRNNGN